MFKVKTVSAAIFLLTSLSAGMSAAHAAGTLMLAPQTISAPGTIGATAGLGNQASYSSNINNASNINVQTNINSSRNIDTSSSISVTNTVNGSQVDYGLNGANTLNVIDNAGTFAAGVAAAQRTERTNELAQTLEVDALRGSEGN